MSGFISSSNIVDGNPINGFSLEQNVNSMYDTHELPIKHQTGELMVIAAYIHVESQSDVKVRTALSEIRSSLHKSFEDCGKDVRIIVLPTTGETKIECIYPKQ